MVRIERAVRIAAPAATAWRVLGDFSAAEIAAGICTRIEVNGAGIGAVRTMYIAGTWGDGYTGGAEVYVKERLESYDEKERCMTYRLVDAGPLPFADYLGSARLVVRGTRALHRGHDVRFRAGRDGRRGGGRALARQHRPRTREPARGRRTTPDARGRCLPVPAGSCRVPTPRLLVLIGVLGDAARFAPPIPAEPRITREARILR